MDVMCLLKLLYKFYKYLFIPSTWEDKKYNGLHILDDFYLYTLLQVLLFKYLASFLHNLLEFSVDMTDTI